MSARQTYYRATVEKPEADDNGRVIRYVFSDSSVARDNHTINTAGWVLDNFLKNPVFLWAHDSNALPVGRVVDIGVSGQRLMGNVEYLERDEYPFADTVYQLVRKGFLNATSVSWQPIDYKFSQDKGRAGGIDFLRQELLEVSQVPVPALPTALVTARAAGIDTQPMHDWLERALDTGGLAMVPRAELEAMRKAARMQMGNHRRSATPDWKVGAARELPVSSEATWDGPAAAERMLDAAGFNGDSPDAEKAARGFLAYDSANPTLKGSFKLPFADIVSGELTAMKGGIDAAAQRLSQTDVPQAVRDEAQKVIDGYETKMKGASRSRAAPGRRKRGLYTVSYLADVLGSLAYIQMSSQQEEQWEQDDSKVPAMLLDGLKQLGAALVAMTAEEVSEMLAGCDVDPMADGMAYAAAARTPGVRVLRTLEMKLRAGRVLSAENEKTLRAAHGQIQEACAGILSVCDAAMGGDGDPEPDTGEDAEKERARRARAIRFRALALATED